MNARLLLLVFLLILPKITKPQSVSTLMGARSNGLGHTSAALCDEWSFFNNIGGLAKVKDLSVDVAYAVNPSLPGSDRMAFSMISPIHLGVAGLGFFRFGDEVYNEQILSAGYSNQFGLASLGLRFNYIQYRAEGFGTKSALSINFGGLAEISDRLLIGAYITNLNQPKLSSDVEENLPVIMAVGLNFHPEENLNLLIELEKDIEHEATLKGGLEYEFYKKFDFRIGFNLQPNALFGGLGFHSHRLKIDYALHFTPYIQTQFQLSAAYLVSVKSTQK